MASTLKVEIDADMMVEAVKRMTKREREEFIEDLLAATSPEYLISKEHTRSQGGL
jgi:hypothetical protein